MAGEGAVVVFLAEFDHQVEEVARVYSILEGKLPLWTGKTVGA
jgi:hypothetical protein